MPTLTLPYPPSMNRLWRHAHGRTYKNPDAQKFQMVAQTQARTLGLTEPLTGPIRLWVSLHPPGKKSIDLDNSMKAAIDALNGIAWLDDSQLVEILARKAEPVEAGALIVEWEAA